MRAVIQRVTEAQVEVGGQAVGRIKSGMLVLLGIAEGDTDADLQYVVDKTVQLRIFEDEEGKMNRSLMDIHGSMLAISQFTLLGDCRKGRRPSFVAAAKPDEAVRLYDAYVAKVKEQGVHVETGIFRADMKVQLVNDGPVTMLVDSTKIL